MNPWRLTGGVLFGLGLFLFCGNVFGFFRTFPSAGFFTCVAGAVFFSLSQARTPR